MSRRLLLENDHANSSGSSRSRPIMSWWLINRLSWWSTSKRKVVESDVAIPKESNIRKTEHEKLEKYQVG